MNRTRIIMNALLAVAALFAAGNAAAQPHTDPPVNYTVALPVTEPAQIADWLQRLVGRFRFDGMIQISMDSCGRSPPDDTCQGAKGKSDCVQIGQGAGVQCILNVLWDDIYTVNYDSGTETAVLPDFLNPAMELFGIDPGKSAVNRLLVNNKGLPEGGLGYIKGNVATFKSPCVNEPAGCYHVVRIEARPDAKLMWWTLSKQQDLNDEMTYAIMTLRRVPIEEESAPTLKAAPALKSSSRQR